MRLNEVLLHSSYLSYELTDSERKRLKETLLEIFKDISIVCEKNDLVYLLGGGSCLGAVRHKGFIPWDDDLDMMMPRKSYNKLAEYLMAAFPEKYFLTGPGYSSDGKFLKVHKKGTIFESLFDNQNDGIEVDIFPIESIPKNRFSRIFHGMKLNFYSFIASCVKLLKNPSSADKYLMHFNKTMPMMFMRKTIGFLFSWKSYTCWILKFDEEASREFKSDFVSIPSGRKHYFGEIHKDDVFFPVTYGEFEGVKVPLPNDCETYLSRLYGDYMRVPNEEDREKHFVTKIDFGE